MAEPKEGHEELVKVFDTDEESEAMVVRGLLESAGIDAMIQNREAPQDILPGVGSSSSCVLTRRKTPWLPSTHIALSLPPTPTKQSARNRRSRHRFSVQVESNSSGQVGAEGLDVRVGESPHHLRPGMLERVVASHRNHRKARTHRIQELRRTRSEAAVMADLQQVGARIFFDQKFLNATMRISNEQR